MTRKIVAAMMQPPDEEFIDMMTRHIEAAFLQGLQDGWNLGMAGDHLAFQRVFDTSDERVAQVKAHALAQLRGDA